ncbi:MAG TPA: DUF1028 domain-containing protein [Vicinamibacterales bacterium]|nr:DUF1028 domain-containing protein [Vicinamibacterales bacterium]
MHIFKAVCIATVSIAVLASRAAAQEPVSWGTGPDPIANTFSIIAVDPRTGETGVAVTSRVICVGAIVPWTRPGVGAVATQGGARIEYGNDLLDLLAKGVSPADALEQVKAADDGRENRQVAVIDLKGDSAQWTGKQQYGARGDYVHMRKGRNYAAQGNSIVSTALVDAVGETFEKSEGSVRPLADRLIEALWAGQVLGGDFRHGAKQSAAVVVADPRPGMSRRPDGISVNISVCEHPEPVGELRRVYDAMTETLGFRPLQMFAGRDVLQLKLMLHALGYYKPDDAEIPMTGAGANAYTEETVAALDAFRAAQEWGTTVPGWVDARVVDRLWLRLKEKGLDDEIRRTMLPKPRAAAR